MQRAYVRINNNFHMVVDVATNGHEIAEGLSNRSYLADHEGMLFLVEHPLPFWMKNMKIPIDIIFLDQDRIVVSIVHYAQPCYPYEECRSYMPDSPYSYVLEVRAGFCEFYNVNIGTQIPFEFITSPPNNPYIL